MAWPRCRFPVTLAGGMADHKRFYLGDQSRLWLRIIVRLENSLSVPTNRTSGSRYVQNRRSSVILALPCIPPNSLRENDPLKKDRKGCMPFGSKFSLESICFNTKLNKNPHPRGRKITFRGTTSICRLTGTLHRTIIRIRANGRARAVLLAPAHFLQQHCLNDFNCGYQRNISATCSLSD